MPFNRKLQKFSASINEVEIGTGDKTVGDATGRYDDFDWEDEE